MDTSVSVTENTPTAKQDDVQRLTSPLVSTPKVAHVERHNLSNVTKPKNKQFDSPAAYKATNQKRLGTPTASKTLTTPKSSSKMKKGGKLEKLLKLKKTDPNKSYSLENFLNSI